MNKYTLRFQSPQLENDYRKSRIQNLRRYFIFTQILVVILSLGFIANASTTYRTLRTLLNPCALLV